MQKNSQTILTSIQDLIVRQSGVLLDTYLGVSKPDNHRPGHIIFVSLNEHLTSLNHATNLLIVASDKIPMSHLENKNYVVSVKDFKLSMARILELFNSDPLIKKSGIHGTAVISPEASIGLNVYIGPYCCIEAGVIIGHNCRLESNVFIGQNSQVGDNCIIRPFVCLGFNSIIGQNVIINSHSTIGSDGFGFHTDRNYKHTKLAQIGNVIIEDNVEIGASCCIDRATIDSTVIKSGTKLDNLCHIAHNCTVGNDSLIAAGFFVAGSSHLGKKFTTGGNSVVSTQIHICDGVTLAGRSTVTNDIQDAGQYGGYPLQPLREALKTIASLSHLVEIRKTLNEIVKKIGLKESK